MNNIKFEGLGLDLNINPVMVDINGIKIYWYAFIIIMGVAVCLLLCRRDDGKYKIKFDDILLLALFLLPIAIICARIYFVLFKLDYYIQNPSELFSIQNGGLAIYGGIIGAIGTIIVFCKIKKIKLLDVLDYLAPYLALGQCIGRWGNFFNGEAHGTETDCFLRMGIVEDGKYIQVHPTFLYESICTLLIFIFLFVRRNKRRYNGELTYWYFFLYGIARAIIEGFRTDSLMLGPLRVSQILSIALSAVFGSLLLYKGIKLKNSKKNGVQEGAEEATEIEDDAQDDAKIDDAQVSKEKDE